MSAIRCKPPADTSCYIPFKAYRPLGGSGLGRRDLEFMWDPINDSTLTDNVRTTLNNFGMTLCDSTGRNPFGYPWSDFQLTYEYFRNPDWGAHYTTLTADTISVFLGHGTNAYKPSDRSHSDVYLFYPTRKNVGGEEPSAFMGGEEDLSTDHSREDIQPLNSIMVFSPDSLHRFDLDGGGWTRPDAIRNVGFDHEFRHSLPQTREGGPLGEMFSAGAEFLGGNSVREMGSEMPYTWGLFVQADTSACNKPRLQGQNYQARSAFTAYLATHFRGQDTSPTLVGLQDDLLHLWVTDPLASVLRFQGMLHNDVCTDCADKIYFRKPDGAALDDTLRFGLLLHNFRVANYVNNSDLEEGQYGYYEDLYGFAPWKQLSAWQSFDGCGPQDDLVAIPPEVTLSSQHLTGDVVLADERSNGYLSYPLVLTMFGSEYWVVRSDPAIQQPGRELVIRIYPDSGKISTFEYYCDRPGSSIERQDARLFASAMGYREQSVGGVPDSLWKHPEWATRPINPRWIDIDTTGPEVIELVVPSFGDSIKAALVVLSLSDGPGQQFMASASGYNYPPEFLTYRLQLMVRDRLTAPNPAPFAANPAVLEEGPTFAPDGGWLAFAETPASGLSQIYVKSLDGQTRYALHPTSWPRRQQSPEWSPRGDWLAYQEWREQWPWPDLHLFNVQTNQERLLTGGIEGVDAAPGFAPNGQRLAYTVHYVGVSGEPDSIWQLRRIDLSGANDVTLVQTPSSRPLHSPRWSPDGAWIYFTAGVTDSLYAVAVEGATQGTVVDRGLILNHAPVFDLHRGHGPIAFEQADTVHYTYVCRFFDLVPDDTSRVNSTPYRRLALRDTLVRLPLPQFDRRFVTRMSPRWSPDGTRIAYVSDEATPGAARDIYLGTVSWNHAPSFSSPPRDTAIMAGHALAIDFAASDPDQETVSYEAACLPAGASQANGHLSWSNPEPGGSEHYVVLRAVDGSGGVVSNVIRITVVPDTLPPVAVSDLVMSAGRSNLVVGWTAPGDDGTQGTAAEYDLRTSTAAINETNFHSATRAGTGDPGPAGALECVEVGNLSQCTRYYAALKSRDVAGNWSGISNLPTVQTLCSGYTLASCDEGMMAQGGGGDGGWAAENSVLASGAGADVLRLEATRAASGKVAARLVNAGRASVGLDQVSLVAVPHASGERAYLSGARFVVGTIEAVGAVTPSEAVATLTGATVDSATVYEGVAGDALVVEPETAKVRLGSLVLEAAVVGAAADPDSSGLEVQVPEGPLGWKTVAHLQPRRAFAALLVDSLNAARVRLVFRSHLELRRLGTLARVSVASPTALALLSAAKSGGGDMLGAVSGAGGSRAVLDSAGTLECVFAAPTGTGAYDLFLGVSTSASSALSLTAATRAADEQVVLPVRFALHQNQPNPFAHSTTIRFDLPVAAAVRLEVFDAQGRRLRTLADGAFPPGFHALAWNQRDDAGAPVAPGVYLYRMRAGTFRAQRKLVVLP